MHIATVYEGTVDPSNVVSGYVYGPVTDPVVGTNTDLDPSTASVIRNPTVGGVLGQQQPDPSAVALGVVIPGVGLGANSGDGSTTPPPVNPPTGNPNDFKLCVTDSNDNPLENVTVIVCTKQITGPDGLVNFNLSPGSYTAEVIYNGRSRGITDFNV